MFPAKLLLNAVESIMIGIDLELCVSFCACTFSIYLRHHQNVIIHFVPLLLSLFQWNVLIISETQTHTHTVCIQFTILAFVNCFSLHTHTKGIHLFSFDTEASAADSGL